MRLNCFVKIIKTVDVVKSNNEASARKDSHMRQKVK